jgi:hypothetical protein
MVYGERGARISCWSWAPLVLRRSPRVAPVRTRGRARSRPGRCVVPACLPTPRPRSGALHHSVRGTGHRAPLSARDAARCCADGCLIQRFTKFLCLTSETMLQHNLVSRRRIWYARLSHPGRARRKWEARGRARNHPDLNPRRRPRRSPRRAWTPCPACRPRPFSISASSSAGKCTGRSN